ncbi:hypothetical protein LJC61_06830 [Ruminococcaceae bacterium OttesenSCG-928-A16]|nr:hypothetical protein [Ruminococcaceae bacterium OttesenSCG-928-A16]
MGFWVTQSKTPLVFDAIPAIKVQHYAKNGLPVYTYARLYALNHDLAVNLCAFERQPAEGSLVGLWLLGTKGRHLAVALGPQTASLTLLQADAPPQALPAPSPARFAGVDEQGWYWGANSVIGADILQQVGIKLAVGRQFNAAVYKSWQPATAGGAFGASAPLTQNGTECPPQNWPPFTVVAY